MSLEGLNAGSVAAVTIDASVTAAAKAAGDVVKGVFDNASDSILISSRRKLEWKAPFAV